jgi:Tfp pilus assembly protein PilO
MQNYDIPLHDIKPILEVQEYSLYYFMALCLFGILLLSGLVYIFYKKMKAKKRFNIRQEHRKLLKNLDVKDTKNAAYSITLYGFTFKDDSPRHSEMYKNLSQRLEAYKYKKNVECFDEEVLGYIELYKGMVDV